MSASEVRQPSTLDRPAVLITGGTSGVGLETAAQFAEAGARGVVINGRNLERGEAARQAILRRVPGANVAFVAGDCNTAAGARAVCEAARERFGRIDVLVNSTTGPYAPKLLRDIEPEEMQGIVIQQLMAPLLTSRIVLPWMTEQGGGAIVNIASDAAKVTTPGETVLSAAMAGIVMFSRTMAIEAKRNGVRVNVVTPSIIENTGNHERVMADPFASKLFGKAIKLAHLGVVNPVDMAQLIVFLASPKASKITGQAISCNGGISAA
jgi:NAD(P)-dependent dehydrogenase (short-subunit alcohol dehydrogenase family)